jgi:antirestriction protein
MKVASVTAPRVWVGCLACYNGGDLVGDWFDASGAPQDVDEWNAVVMPRSPFHAIDKHEELWVFDHEGFAGLLSGECSPAEARCLAEVLDEIDEDAEAYAAWISDTGTKASDGVAEFREVFHGIHNSERDYAQQLAEDIGAVSGDESWPLSCVDWERAARDLFCGDYWSAPVSGGVAVFASV